MSDEISLEARLAVIAGFAYSAGKTGATWEAAMDEGLRKAASAMNAASRYAKTAQAVLDSSVFRGEYRGYTLEESSTRLIVEIYTGEVNERSKRKDGIEEIRTERTDTFVGKLMRRRLDALPQGATILAFKSLQQMSGSSDKVRILAHFEILATGSAPTASPEAAQAPVTRQPEPPKPAEAPPSTSAGRDDDPFNKVSVNSLVGDMPGPKAAKLARLARAEGIDNIMAEAHADRIRELIATLE